jgi:hypothetical protein
MRPSRSLVRPAEQLGPPHPELGLAECLQPLDLSPDLGFPDFAHDGTRIWGLEKAAPGNAGSGLRRPAFHAVLRPALFFRLSGLTMR